MVFLFLNPKGRRIKVQRAQHNEFVENELKNSASMDQATRTMD